MDVATAGRQARIELDVPVSKSTYNLDSTLPQCILVHLKQRRDVVCMDK